MLIHEPGAGEKLKSAAQIPYKLKRELIYRLSKMARSHTMDDPEKVGEDNEALIKQLRESAGTEPGELLKEKAKAAREFIEKMREGGMPGAEEISTGSGEKTRGYIIGAVGCGPELSDNQGQSYISSFGAEVALCEGGELRARLGGIYVDDSFSVNYNMLCRLKHTIMGDPLPDVSFDDFDPEAFSDVTMTDDFETGRMVSLASGEARLYPVPAEQLFGELAGQNLPGGA